MEVGMDSEDRGAGPRFPGCNGNGRAARLKAWGRVTNGVGWGGLVLQLDKPPRRLRTWLRTNVLRSASRLHVRRRAAPGVACRRRERIASEPGHSCGSARKPVRQSSCSSRK